MSIDQEASELARRGKAALARIPQDVASRILHELDGDSPTFAMDYERCIDRLEAAAKETGHGNV